MRGIELAKKILALADVVYRWLGALSQLEPERKARVARGAKAIADTIGPCRRCAIADRRALSKPRYRS